MISFGPQITSYNRYYYPYVNLTRKWTLKKTNSLARSQTCYQRCHLPFASIQSTWSIPKRSEPAEQDEHSAGERYKFWRGKKDLNFHLSSPLLDVWLCTNHLISLGHSFFSNKIIIHDACHWSLFWYISLKTTLRPTEVTWTLKFLMNG